jgi:hypothetical protein
MSYIAAVGITVGLLAGAWVYVSGLVGITAFAGFLGWASYFAAGGGKDGSIKAICCNLSGVLWGAASGVVPAQAGIAVIVVLAAIMCWQANFPLLSFIPGAFIGNACFYANGNDWLGTSIGLLCGVALGFMSDYSAKYISRAESSKEEEAKDR